MGGRGRGRLRSAGVEFSPDPKGVRERVTFDSEQTHAIEQQRQGWQAILDNFASYIEGQVAAGLIGGFSCRFLRMRPSRRPATQSAH